MHPFTWWRRPPPSALSLLGRAQVSGDGVVLDGLVQHQSQQPGSVGHGHAEVPLLLEEFVQLVPLTEGQKTLTLSSSPVSPASISVTAVCELPLGLAPGPPLHVAASPSSSVCCTSALRRDRTRPWARRHLSPEDNRTPHRL